MIRSAVKIRRWIFRRRAGLDPPYSAACAFTSADTWRMARASCSAGCAPDTAYFCANTKVGTPEMPLSEASLA